MTNLYELIIFSNTNMHYTDAIVNYLDPENKYISHRLYRDSCFYCL